MKIWFPALAEMWSSFSVSEVIWGEESSVVHFSSVSGTSLANNGKLLRVSSAACVEMNINRILGQGSIMIGYLVFLTPFGESECCGARH